MNRSTAIGFVLLVIGISLLTIPEFWKTWIPKEQRLLPENFPFETDGLDYLKLASKELYGKVRNIVVEIEVNEVDGAPFELYIVGKEGYEKVKRDEIVPLPLYFVRKEFRADNHYRENFTLIQEELEDGLWFRGEPVYDSKFSPSYKSPLTFVWNLSVIWEEEVPKTFIPLWLQRTIGGILIGMSIGFLKFWGSSGTIRLFKSSDDS